MQKYSAQLRVIHWLMFLCFSALFVIGYFMTEFKQAEPWSWYALHKSLGVSVFLLLLVRWFIRFKSTLPVAAEYMSSVDEKISKSVIHTMYILMLSVPIGGYLMSNMAGHAVALFGLSLPTLAAESADYKELAHDFHAYSAYTFLAVIGLHLLGVIRHHIKGNEVLRRIT